MASHATDRPLGILLPGLGAVGSTLIAGVLAARNGLGAPIGSLSQLGRVDPGDGKPLPIPQLVDLAALDDVVFGGWDPITPNALEAARTSGVLGAEHLDALSGELEGIVPMDAVFDQRWVSRLDGVRVKSTAGHWASAEALIDDIARFRTDHGCDRVVMVWCGSTEAYSEPCEIHRSVAAFEQALRDDDPRIAPSQIYAYAAIQSGVPVANGSPNLMLDLPCMVELAEARGVPIAGRDFKTGQTLMKTILAPGLRARMLGIRGWYSTNI
ncbi:MAG: inositol-3-phosphate synthase, partial [Actinobacteria bacterium]|nr:inositol-3-phosphate synthase [Actinomycetota bacterium]